MSDDKTTDELKRRRDEAVARATADRAERQRDWIRRDIDRATHNLTLLDEAAEHNRMQQRALAEYIDTRALQLRPTYPTPGQLAGIADAALAVRTRRTHPTHHGERARAGELVSVHGERGWIGIEPGAPSSKVRSSERLWSYDDDDVTALLAAVREAGLVVGDHWIGGFEGALCMNVSPAPPTRHLWCGGRWNVEVALDGTAWSFLLVDGESHHIKTHDTWADAMGRVDRIMRATLAGTTYPTTGGTP